MEVRMDAIFVISVTDYPWVVIFSKFYFIKVLSGKLKGYGTPRRKWMPDSGSLWSITYGLVFV